MLSNHAQNSRPNELKAHLQMLPFPRQQQLLASVSCSPMASAASRLYSVYPSPPHCSSKQITRCGQKHETLKETTEHVLPLPGYRVSIVSPSCYAPPSPPVQLNIPLKKEFRRAVIGKQDFSLSFCYYSSIPLQYPAFKAQVSRKQHSI